MPATSAGQRPGRLRTARPARRWLGLLTGQATEETALLPRGLGGCWSSSPTAEESARPARRCSELLARPDPGVPSSWRAGWSSSPRRRRTSVRPARRCSGCWLVGPTLRAAAELAAGVVQLNLTAEDKRQAREALLGLLASSPRPTVGTEGDLYGRPQSWWSGVVQLDPDSGGQAPGPRGAARVAGGETDGSEGRGAGGRGGPARRDGGGQAPGPRGAARAAGPVQTLTSPMAASWRTGLSSSTRRRRTSARPARRCSSCWPVRRTARHGAAKLVGRAGPARPDGGGQAPGPRGAARASRQPSDASAGQGAAGLPMAGTGPRPR